MSKQFTEEKTYTKMLHLMLCSNTLVIRENLVRSKSYYSTPIRLANIRKLEDRKCRQVCGDRGNFT